MLIYPETSAVSKSLTQLQAASEKRLIDVVGSDAVLLELYATRNESTRDRLVSGYLQLVLPRFLRRRIDLANDELRLGRALRMEECYVSHDQVRLLREGRSTTIAGALQQMRLIKDQYAERTKEASDSVRLHFGRRAFNPQTHQHEWHVRPEAVREWLSETELSVPLRQRYGPSANVWPVLPVTFSWWSYSIALICAHEYQGTQNVDANDCLDLEHYAYAATVGELLTDDGRLIKLADRITESPVKVR